MGLDMYAYKVERDLICSWRKHNRLHGWMENRWRERTGKEDEFNCVDFYLDMEDLEQLEKDIFNFDLPETEGFFFGSTYDEDEYIKEYREQDLEFLEEAKQVVKSGGEICYSSWW